MNRIRFWLIRLLGVKQCGQFGGAYSWGPPAHQLVQRWCTKPFGHRDSCAYETLPDRPISQPGFILRARAKGHTHYGPATKWGKSYSD